MKAVNEDKLMYKFCYKCPGKGELMEILRDRKSLAELFKKIEKALRYGRVALTPILTLKEIRQLERYILALEFVEENTVSKLNRIEEIL